jgi:hypothetical protein
VQLGFERRNAILGAKQILSRGILPRASLAYRVPGGLEGGDSFFEQHLGTLYFAGSQGERGVLQFHGFGEPVAVAGKLGRPRFQLRSFT